MDAGPVLAVFRRIHAVGQGKMLVNMKMVHQ